jgi:L-ribulose-5-phosphate 3-epimerase
VRPLEPLEPGLMFWAGESADATLREVQSFGLKAGQIGIPGELSLAGQSGPWQKALSAHDVLIVTAVCSYAGESYADIPAVQQTVGLVPTRTRAERIARTKTVSDFAAALDITSVACHIGFIPHDRGDPLYSEMVDVTRDICDHCYQRGQSFALETGQEPVQVLLQFLEDAARPNLKINFDPANLILYGTGDPLEALDLLGRHVISVHCKDGEPPPAGMPDALGRECRLGEGSVDVPRFIHKLHSIGYSGILSIEREEPDPKRRAADIRHAVGLLTQLTAGYENAT